MANSPMIKLIEPTLAQRRGFLDYLVRAIVAEAYQRKQFEDAYANAQKELMHQREAAAGRKL